MCPAWVFVLAASIVARVFQQVVMPDGHRWEMKMVFVLP